MIVRSMAAYLHFASLDTFPSRPMAWIGSDVFVMTLSRLRRVRSIALQYALS